jgi:transcription elongation factor GreA
MSVPMTRKGFDKLQAELVHLKKVERPKVITDIAEARAHGDLKENAEYAAAKEKQSFIEGRIIEVGSQIALAQVIDTTGLSTEKVVFGATVTLMNIETEEEKTYTLVGVDEADMKEKKISILSPVAKALVGKYVGDEVKISTPAKIVPYEILKITFE